VKTKILHVSQATGGVETSLLLLFRHLDRRRFDIHLACPPGTGLAAKASRLGVSVFEIPMVRRADPFWDVLALLGLARLIRRERYAAVHAHSAKGGYLGRLAARLVPGPRTIYVPQAFSYLSQTGVARRVFLGLERLAVPWTDVLHASSESEKARAVREVGFPDARVVVIPNSVDIEEAEAVQKGESPTEPIVLTVGRLAYQKNPEMFVRVARRVLDRRPGTGFVMAGAGFASPLEQQVKSLVRVSGVADHVRIVPWADRAETLRLVATCSVFALTSRYEGLPYSLLEAMMLRKPAVATDVDGSRDVLAGSVGGFLVPPDDDVAMANRIVALLEDPALARRTGEAGFQRVRECYDIRKTVQAIEALYGELLGA